MKLCFFVLLSGNCVLAHLSRGAWRGFVDHKRKIVAVNLSSLLASSEHIVKTLGGTGSLCGARFEREVAQLLAAIEDQSYAVFVFCAATCTSSSMYFSTVLKADWAPDSACCRLAAKISSLVKRGDKGQSLQLVIFMQLDCLSYGLLQVAPFFGEDNRAFSEPEQDCVCAFVELCGLCMAQLRKKVNYSRAAEMQIFGAAIRNNFKSFVDACSKNKNFCLENLTNYIVSRVDSLRIAEDF